MINDTLFLEAAEYAGFKWEFAERKVSAYLESRGDGACIESFVLWLGDRWQDELKIRENKLNNGENK